MSVLHYQCTPIKKSLPSADTRSADETYKSLRNNITLHNIDKSSFVETFLFGNTTLQPEGWTSHEQQLLKDIKNIHRGQERSFYSSRAPLLRLLNHISEQTFRQCQTARKALIFYPADKTRITNPFTAQDCRPDIIALWVESQTFPLVDYSVEKPISEPTWYELAAVGEVKVTAHGKYQMASYLQNHLQLHPELNAVLGFTARKRGYSLFYHDAAIIYQSTFDWEPGPLYAFVAQLYSSAFRDVSMQVLDPITPAWATQIGNEVYLSETPRALPGPGQRRFTTRAIGLHSNEAVFIKESWRAQCRLFFEGLLFEQAHKGTPLPGLMLVYLQGYVPDGAGALIRTTSLLPSPKEQANGRFKMRMVTKDIGRPLEGLCSLREFLCAMYDACAVQLNLYRKCGILHRDISDGNIMFAPLTDEYRERCGRGHAEVKFVNQVLSKDRDTKPDPACLVIDLGNGADLKVKRGQEALTKRTGTPKFIARSVSSGTLLVLEDYNTKDAKMPPMIGPAADYQQFMHSIEYQAPDNSEVPPQLDVKFSHHLFHDAESMFWVITWILARSIAQGSQALSEEETSPEDFCEFFHTMYRHNPSPKVKDSRLRLGSRARLYWTNILHPDLAQLSGMLKEMYEYIRPEWAYRPDLDAEHVHEALMRLLLIEIVRIDQTGNDIPIIIGGRPIPPPPENERALPSSTLESLSKSVSSAQTSSLMPSQHESAAGAGSEGIGSQNKQNETSSAEPQMLGLDHDIQQLSLGPDSVTGHRVKGPITREWLIERGRSLEWEMKECDLKAPNPDI